MRRKDASCECFSLSEVHLGEGQPVAALSVDSRGLSHGPARGKWMVRPNRRRFWRAQPSRSPLPRYGARRERATARPAIVVSGFNSKITFAGFAQTRYLTSETLKNNSQFVPKGTSIDGSYYMPFELFLLACKRARWGYVLHASSVCIR